MLSYLNFNTPILGRSYTAAFIFEPTYRLNDRMDFIIRTRVGLSYMTNPHDSLKIRTTRPTALISIFILRWVLESAIKYHRIILPLLPPILYIIPTAVLKSQTVA